MKRLQRAVSTGCRSLDRVLKGGFPINAVSLVYGEAETGKTSLAIQCAVGSARTGSKTIFIDSDGMFSPRRLLQISYDDFEETSPFIAILRPTTFQEQAFAIDHLEEYLTEKVGLVVVDTVTSLYRVEFGTPKEAFILNRELNRQIACLAQIAKTHNVAILITSQVRSVLAEGKDEVEPVATRVLRFWSDVVIDLKHTSQTRVIRAFINKHPEHKRPASCYFRIEKTGVREFSR